MARTRQLHEVAPATHLLLETADVSEAANAMLAWRDEGLTVRLVRGQKMRTVHRLFDEVAAALQFPTYFGENWPAFDECLCDMDWLPAGAGVVVTVTDPGEVLVDAPEAELGVLVRSIARAAATYSQPIERGEWWDRSAVPFHVVLQDAGGSASNAYHRWAAAGAFISPFAS